MLAKCTALAALAVAASAFVGTSPALAESQWTMGGKLLTETAKAEFSGEFAVGTPKGTITCLAGFTITVASNGKATAETRAFSPTGCDPLTGSLKGCFVIGGKGTAMPWEVDTLTKDWDITNVKIDYQLDSSCGTKEVSLTFAKITVTPFDYKNIKNTSYTATGESNLGGTELLSEFEAEKVDVFSEPGEGTTGTFSLTE